MLNGGRMPDSPPDSAIVDNSVIVDDSPIPDDSVGVHKAKHKNASQF